MRRSSARSLRRLCSLSIAGWLALALWAGSALAPERSRANGVGDLYVATPTGVAEVLVATGEVLARVPLRAAPRALAFDPGGAVLYATGGAETVEPIDIESLEATAALPLPGRATALAHPSGGALVVALAGDRRLAIVDPTRGTTTRSAALPGPADLLAADRRREVVLAAESGKPWLALLDRDARLVSTTLDGRVTAIAVSVAGDLVVATRAPATVRRLAARDLDVAWSVSLPAAPDAVAVVTDGVVAAAGRSLFWVDGAGAKPWRTLASPVTALAASDDGGVLYAATEAGLDAITVDGRAVHVAVDLVSGPGTLAPVPRPASLAGSGPGSSVGAGDRPPSTSTIGPAVRPEPAIGVGLAAALVVLFAAVAVARRVGGAGS